MRHLPALERQRAFLDFTLRSLARRKGRNLSLVLAYSLTVFLIASALLTTLALRQEAEAVLAGAPELILQRTMAGRHELIPIDYAAAVSAVRGVGRVEPRLWGYYFHMAAGANLTVLGRADFPHADDEMILGQGARRVWEAAGGPREGLWWLRGHDGRPFGLKLAEVLDPETEFVSSDLVVVSERAFRRLFGMPVGLATDLAVSIRNEQEASTIVEKILLALPDTRPILRAEILRTYASAFDWRGGVMLVLLVGAVAAFLLFAWDKATGLSAEEKAEIGVLKALGWDTGDVLAVKMWEGLVVSFSGFLLGTLAAWAHVSLAGVGLLAEAMRGWAVLTPRFELTPSLDPATLLALFLLSVAPYTLITVYPAWRAAAADPDAVMRGTA